MHKLVGTSLRYLETDLSEVEGTIIEVDEKERRYKVEWNDAFRPSWVCADSPAVISPLPTALT